MLFSLAPNVDIAFTTSPQDTRATEVRGATPSRSSKPSPLSPALPPHSVRSPVVGSVRAPTDTSTNLSAAATRNSISLTESAQPSTSGEGATPHFVTEESSRSHRDEDDDDESQEVGLPRTISKPLDFALPSYLNPQPMGLSLAGGDATASTSRSARSVRFTCVDFCGFWIPEFLGRSSDLDFRLCTCMIELEIIAMSLSSVLCPAHQAQGTTLCFNE